MQAKTKRATTAIAVQVTTPVVKIQHDKNDYTNVYVLRDKNYKFRMPGVKDESPRAWDYGPSIITERVGPGGNTTVTYHPDDPRLWDWLGALICVGSHAMTTDDIHARIPKELKAYWG